MPTYEYACESCGHRFDIFQSMKDAPLSDCPECSQGTVRRVIGQGAGIIFKGSGFYQTDYRKDSNSGSRGNDAEKTSDKSEKAPASKSDAPTGSAAKEN